MKKSKFTILLLFLVMILAISAASAADLDDTSDSAVQAVDEAAVDEVASADVDDVVSTDNTANVLATGGKNFTSLKDDIASVQDTTKTLKLESNYTRVGNEAAIEITDTIIINGEGIYTIDGNNNGGIFDVKQGGVLILQNVFLINGNTEKGGAIYNNGNVLVTDTQFSGNNASLGGAIYNTNTGYVKLTGSTLDGNTATYGGAVYNLGELEVDKISEFKDNTATYKGGAIYSEGTVDVSGSTFDGNDIKYRSGKNTDFNGGAAIYNLKGNLTVDNSKFKNNVKNYEIRSATDFDNLDGAVTSISGTVAISNSEFRNNSARYGSAILISSLQDGADGTFTIDNCQFYDNLALAGAIQVWDRDKKFEFTILNSWFENNTATGITDPDHTAAGGALAFIDVKEAKINGTTFKENKVTNIAKKPKGGAINIQGSNVDIDYCTFEANHADTNGGAINVYSGSVDVNNSKFINNDATINGGAINLDNYTAYGYAIAVANVENSNFTGNTATAAGNAIYNNGKLALSGNTIDAGANIVSSGTITSPIIAVVTADKTTYRIEQITLTARLTDDMGTVINDTTFKFVFNTPAGLAAIPATLGDDGNYTVRFTPTKDGEYNVTVNHAGDITNATFTVYRTLTDLKELVENATDGDTINLDGDYTYNDEFDASFTGIVTSSSLTINGNGYTICGQDKTCNLFNVSGHKLTLNNLTICHFNNTVDGLGGAISVSPSGTLTANYVNFTDNTAKYKGGAIYNNGGTVIVNHTVFDGNDIKYRSGANQDFNGGAAIYNLKGTLTVDDSTIKNNVKNYEIRSDTDFDNLDGAITSISGTVAISNSEFRNNSARYGSAILISAVDDADGTFTIDNCQFYDNLALAGAIQVWDRKNKFEFTILNSWFENNTATGDTDIAHTAAGGALVLTNVKEAKINGTTFKENKVIHIAKKPKGGAINIQDCNHVDIDYCTFEGNHADTNGGAINVYSGSVDVNNSKFINNDATINGGAINIENNTAAGYAIGVATVENSNFTGNTAANGNAINNNGKLTLSKNIISTNQADIVSEGEIESQINVTTHNAVVHYGEKVNLTATITDDKGNLINSSDFYFVVNTVNYGPAVYNPATGKYEFEQEFSLPVGTYEITMYREGKELTYVEKGNLTATPKKGTYSDLQAQIDALAPGETLELTYDFAYDATYDDAKFPNGVVINKALTINGNDHFISGADTVRIFRIGTFANANISGVVFKNGKADKGGALFVAGKLSIDNCTFVNNTATVSGNDIHIMTSSVAGDIVSIKNSVFDSDGYSIYNLGALDLENNTIKGVIYNNGTIISEINAVVLDNKTINVTSKTYELNATLTDDIGNKIYDPELRFSVNGEKIADKPDYNNGLYTFTSNKFTTDYPSYLIDLSSDNEFSLAAETGIIINVLRGTFTDLQQRIDAANSELNLTYNFTYSDEFDSALKDGVVIDESIVINGNAVTIDANNTARIFNITNNAVLTLTNATLTNGKANLGGAIYVNAGSTLKADYVNFTNNNATYKGGAVYSKGTVIANHTVFDGNDIEYRASRNNRDFNGGAAIYNSKGTLTVDNSIIKNNVKNYGIRNATDYDNLDGAITSISGIVNISNSEFRNNSARYGSAILISSEDATDGTFTIDNCQFYDNIALAGAIQVWDRSNKFEFTILNSWFENNTATGNTTLGHTAAGGALVLNSVKKAKINGTTFKENKVTHIANNPKGGAINIEKPTYLPDAIVDIEIDNCTFDNNHADSNGGAINLNDGNLNVINSKFINNDATNNGGAIHVEKGAADVEGSNFTGNTATKGASIYNAGNLTLSKNNITSGKSEIESTGLIKSELNATFLDNKTWNDTGIGDIYTLNATLTDDNGNNIYDPNFRFAVNGVNITDIPKYNETTGLYTIGYPITTAGPKVVSTNYQATNLKTYDGILDIAKANVTEFTVVVGGETGRILFGENATVEITLLGVNGEKLNVTDMVVVVNNTPYLVNITNGTGSFNVSGLLPGDYAAVAMYKGDGNYNGKYDTGVFTVLSPDLGIKVNIEDITYLDYPVINVTVGDDTFSGFVTVTIDDKEFIVPVILGKGSLLAFYVFDAGLHTYNATFAGDETYAPVQTADQEFKVGPRKVFIEIVAEDGLGVNYGETGAIVVIIEDEDGNRIIDNITLIFSNETGVLATVEGETSDTHDFRGANVIELPFTANWEKGIYNITAESPKFIFMHFDDESPVIYEFISYADANGITEHGNGTVEANETIEFVPVTVLTNNAIDANAGNFVGMTFYVKVDPKAGEDTIYQLYIMDNNAIVPAPIYVKISETGQEGVYEFVSYADSEGTIKHGNGTAKAGDSIEFISVTVLTNNAIDANAPNFVGETFYVKVDPDADADAIYQLYIDYNDAIVPVDIYVKISEIIDPVTFEYLVHKHYIYGLNVTEGDGTYEYGDDHVVVIESGSWDDDDNWTIIEINCNATVVVFRYDEDDDKYVEVDTIETKFVDGVLLVNLSDLLPGDYRLKVSISDDTYELHSSMYVEEIDKDVELDYILLYNDDNLFDVQRADVDVIVTVDNDPVTYGENATVTITIITPNGEKLNETVEVNGLPDIDNVTLVNGTITFNASGINAGQHTIWVNFFGTNNYWDSYNNIAQFNVDKATPTLDVNDTEVVYDGEPVEIPFTIIGANGEVIKGEVIAVRDFVEEQGLVNYDETTGKGTITFVKLPAGDQIITVRFISEDSNYNNVNKTITLTIKEGKVNFTAKVVNDTVTYPGDVQIKVNASVAGKVTITVDKDYEFDVQAGETNLTISGLAANTYSNVLVHFEADNYNSSEETVAFDVVQGTPAIAVETIVSKDTYPGAVTVMVTSDVDGTYNITVGNETKQVTIKDGAGYETFSDIAAGPQNATVTYLGEDVNYKVTTVKKEFTINKADPTGVCEVQVIHYPDDLVITIEGTDGVYNASVDAEHFVEITVVGGNGTGNISGLAAGIYNLTVNYIENKNYNPKEFKFEFVVYKHESYVEIDPVTETVTYPGAVNITFTALHGVPVFNVTDANGNDVSFTPVDNKIVLTGLAAGTYTVKALIKETQNYTADYDEITFDVEKAVVVIEPKATGEFLVDGKVNVTFALPTDIDGTVTVYVDGVAYPGELDVNKTTGVYTVYFNAFNAGSHTFIATLTNDSNYVDAMGQTSFDIAKVNPTVVINVEDNLGMHPVPDAIVIIVGDFNIGARNATGTVLIQGLGELRTAELNNEGTYVLDLYDLPADDYEVTVIYMGDEKFNNATNSTKFTVPKLAAPEVIVNITDTQIVGQKDVVVNITVGDNFAYPGNVTVYVDGNATQTVAIDEYGNVTVTIPALENGTHIIGVKYNGNAYFNASDIVNKTLTVTKAPSSVTIIPIDNVTYGSTIKISYTIVNETDHVTILVTDEAGTTYEKTIEGGVITIDYVIPAGKYTVSIYNPENGFYTASEANITFNVTKGPEIDINVAENTTTPTFTITLPEDAKGNLLVDIDGNHYYAPVVNGTATVTVPPLAAGNYTANITYTGDGKYPEISNTTNVSVPSNLPDDAISIPTTATTLNPTFGVNLPSDAGGYIEVDVDGKKYYAVVENGKASVSVPGLSTGEHNVTVTYSGDGKYTKISKSATVTLTEPVPGLKDNKNINVIYSGSATYKVLVTLDGKAAVGETVTIKYNGKTYTVKSDSNGYATLKLNTKVKVKTYTITATYKGVTVTNKVKVKHILKVKNKVVKKSKKVTKVKITLKKLTTAKKTTTKTTTKKSSKSKAKYVKVKFRGKTYKVKVKKNVATWKVKKSMVKKLKVGKKYKYKVTYGKDVVTKKLKIKR